MYLNLEDHGDACYGIRGRMYVRVGTCILPVHLQLEKQKGLEICKNIANEERMKEMEARITESKLYLVFTQNNFWRNMVNNHFNIFM